MHYNDPHNGNKFALGIQTSLVLSNVWSYYGDQQGTKRISMLLASAYVGCFRVVCRKQHFILAPIEKSANILYPEALSIRGISFVLYLRLIK